MAEEKKPVVLVCDDMEINRIMLESLLMAYGVESELVADGEECIKKFNEKSFDMIFLDNHMPDKDGYETLKELKAVSGSKNAGIPVVCYTAYEPTEGQEDYEGAGFDAVLNKPIEPDELSEILKKFLSERYDLQDKKEESEEQKSIRLKKEKEILPKWIFEVSGIDIDEGIKNCDNANDYINALTIFVSSIDDKAKEIRDYLLEGNIRMYTLRVHSLKSIAGLVGLKELSKLAAQLENAGKTGDTKIIEEKTDMLIDLYVSFKQPLLRIFDEVIISEDNSKKILPPISDETLNDAYMSMTEFVYCYDAGSIKMVLDALADYKLKEDDEIKIGRIKKAVKKLDWEALRNIFGI